MRVLTRTTSIRLRSETHQELQQIADIQRIPPAQLMRSALDVFLHGYREERRRKVAAEQAAESATNTKATIVGEG